MLQFGSSSFHGVLDKGTLDAMLCGEGSAAHADAFLAEVFLLFF